MNASPLLILISIGVVIFIVALVDIICFGQLHQQLEEHGPISYDDWIKTPEGRLAKKPFGAIVVLVRRRFAMKG